MIEFLYVVFTTFVALAVVNGVRIEWGKLKRRMDEIDFRTASTDNDVAGQHFRIEALEAAERARKELTK